VKRSNQGQANDLLQIPMFSLNLETPKISIPTASHDVDESDAEEDGH
jgi:hypothetical protein